MFMLEGRRGEGITLDCPFLWHLASATVLVMCSGKLELVDLVPMNWKDVEGSQCIHSRVVVVEQEGSPIV